MLACHTGEPDKCTLCSFAYVFVLHGPFWTTSDQNLPEISETCASVHCTPIFKFRTKFFYGVFAVLLTRITVHAIRNTRQYTHY